MDRDTDKDWERVAQASPYWGVLSVDKFQGVTLDDATLQEFFSSGERLIGNIFGVVSRYVDPKFRPVRSLDFGCGVGRLLVPLSKLCAEVVGVDVSPRMLEVCADHLGRFGVSNVSLVRGDDDLAAVEGKFDFVNSYIVMQHIPPRRGFHLLERLMQLLKPGGSISIQLTYGKARRYLQHEISRARFYRREGNAIYDLAAIDKPAVEGTITMYDYDLNNVFAIMSQYCGGQIVCLPTFDDGHLGVHILAQRKPVD